MPKKLETSCFTIYCQGKKYELEKLSERDILILKFFHSHPGVSQQYAAKEIGVSYNTIVNTLKLINLKWVQPIQILKVFQTVFISLIKY
jgi:hypothetical protein